MGDSAAAVVLAGLAIGLAAPVAAQRIEGRVTDQAGAPVDGAEVYLSPIDSAAIAATVADREGRFGFDAPPPGTYVLRAKRYGFTAGADTVALRIGETVNLTIVLNSAPVAVDPIVVRAERERPEWGATQFERRRWLGEGVFLDHEWIQAFDPSWAEEIFREVPTILVFLTRPSQRNPAGIRLISTESNQRCVDVWVNGIPHKFWIPLDHVVHPDDIMGVEIYRNQREIPDDIVYHGHCALVLYWTRGAWSPEAAAEGRGIGPALVGAGVAALLLLLLLL